MGAGGKGGGGGGGISDIEFDPADPTKALAQFQFAADSVAQGINTLLPGLHSGLADALNSTVPFSQTAVTAMDELRQMVGLKPLDTIEEQATNTLNSMLDAYYGTSPDFITPTIEGAFTSLRSGVHAASRATDPAEREKLINQVYADIDDVSESILWDTEKAWEYLNTGQYGTGPTTSPETFEFAQEVHRQNQEESGLKFANVTGLPALTQMGMLGASLNPKSSALWSRLVGDDGLVTGTGEGTGDPAIEFRDKADFFWEMRSDLIELKDQIQKDFKVEPVQKLSGEEITSRVTESPEFVASYDVGLDALQRQQAAQGHLMSGRALLEAQDYGQRLAGNVYQNHVARLAQLAGLNLPIQQQATQVGQQNTQTGFNVGFLPPQARQSAFTEGGRGIISTEVANAQATAQIVASQNAANAQLGAAKSAQGSQLLGAGLQLLGGLF